MDYPDPPTAVTTPITLEDSHVAISPLATRLRIGGTMEFNGYNTCISGPRVHAILKAAAESFTDWEDAKPHSQPWAGLRPVTPDGLPVIGHIPGYTNALIASGHGMLGLTLAPSTAKAITQLIRRNTDDTLFPSVSPARFQNPRFARM